MLEKVDALKTQLLSFAVNCRGRALRTRGKNGVEDPKKAARYLELCIQEIEPK